MPIDPSKAVGAELPERHVEWEEADVLLYHLALGAGSRPGDQTDPKVLRYTMERDLHVLPSFGVVTPTLRETDSPSLELPDPRQRHGPHPDQQRVGQGQGRRDRAGVRDARRLG